MRDQMLLESYQRLMTDSKGERSTVRKKETDPEKLGLSCWNQQQTDRFSDIVVL